MTASGVLRAADRRFRPWKNGGGETAEIVVAPPGADFESFSWRISTAIVAASGPFSAFPGVDRVLSVVDGDGAMVLTVGENEHRLDAASNPLAFPGDVPAAALLEGGGLLDFNVMVRRPLRAEVTRGPFDPARKCASERARYVLLLEEGAGLERLDLVVLATAAPALVAALAGTNVLDARIVG
ncbi:hypothetical protein FHS82_001441 [Pseudochelatococcus lubricantis]|uniref:HutD family protein n=1 Tax=Pseudochelatococcus lubricantis TaxID=1538102 RepID=A0ABX0V041_9HYPH|nr:HutD family protein [Pseudochelatococcus lubricantis]NIJ57605.1 hypothetical protein [Pseudochelatococcus lubricantis]